MGDRGTGRSVVVVDYDFPDLAVEEAVFAAAGVRLEGRRCRQPAQVVEAAAEADGILVQYLQLGPEALDGLNRCRVIGRYGVGYDNVDVAAATSRGIAVVNVPQYGQDEVSDHALALMLAWLRRIPLYNDQVHRGEWAWQRGRPVRRLGELTAGICGFGRIGQRLAPKLRALGFQVLAYDPYLDEDPFGRLGVSRCSFDALLAAADVISIHLPLTEETHHLFDAGVLARMKPGSLLVNTSRGGVVDTLALARALETGPLAGACLDVMEEEPPGAHPLVGREAVLLTPHAAWYSEASLRDLRAKAARGVLDVLEGRRPAGLVNDELAERLNLAD